MNAVGCFENTDRQGNTYITKELEMRAAWSLLPRQQESEGHSRTIQLLCRRDNAESGSEKQTGNSQLLYDLCNEWLSPEQN